MRSRVDDFVIAYSITDQAVNDYLHPLEASENGVTVFRMEMLDPIITRFLTEGRPRVWSLVITVFGDSVQMRGGQISLARLRMIFGRIGIEAGALRTAMSRLAADGWVSVERQGRTSHYRLTDLGRKQFIRATSLIYAKPAEQSDARLIVHNGSSGLQVGSGLRLEAEGADLPDATMILRAEVLRMGDDVKNTILSDDHRAALAALAADLDDLSRLVIDDPLTAVAARTLLVHRWRRLLLRYGEVPHALMPQSFPLRDPRRKVAQAYWAVFDAAEEWLSTQDSDSPPLAAADPKIMDRFGGR